MTPHRVVLDANVIVSALIRPDSAPGRILRAAVEGRVVLLVTSVPLLGELLAVLNYPRLQRYLKMSVQERQAFVVLLEQIAEPVSLAYHPETGTCRDPPMSRTCKRLSPGGRTASSVATATCWT